MVPMLSALPLNMGPNGNVNLSCKANQLDAHQLASYKWKWMFNNGTEITNAFGKYKILKAFSSLNSCQQKEGTVSLQIENLKKEDLGTYKCALLQSDMEIAIEDVSLGGYGMFNALDSTLYGFDKKSNTLITRLTNLFPIFQAASFNKDGRPFKLTLGRTAGAGGGGGGGCPPPLGVL